MSDAMDSNALLVQELQEEICRLTKINTVLMDRAERSANAQHTEFDMFQTALMLENQVRERTGELEHEKEEQRLLIEKLESTQSQLIQSEKMSAIGQLAAGVAHEINNPVSYVTSNLGTLTGYVNELMRLLDAYALATKNFPGDRQAMHQVDDFLRETNLQFVRDDISSLLAESRDGLERVKRIVADLKDFSRVSDSDWQVADIHRGLESTLNVVKNEIKYKANVVKEFGELPSVWCMPFRLNQVFMNLIVNASHAIKENGQITLRTGTESNCVWVEVEDNGDGISPENLNRIFEPFFTTKPAGVGTGLGLSVSYGIVQKHQGRIEVRSVLGKGTVFRVTLPITSDARDAF